ncbi:hypothetical protein Y032_0246g4 [Ancylostoma ceylanicum]|uniref:Uncharacterized protein n=1 Tax=Ancylostoma ceylanicum TaxID=53326 RepID=A0A016SCY2_9BILA|nr:hypothetical protein Y032_0246g4 [Ancylostoma ceylanicum]
MPFAQFKLESLLRLSLYQPSPTCEGLCTTATTSVATIILNTGSKRRPYVHLCFLPSHFLVIYPDGRSPQQSPLPGITPSATTKWNKNRRSTYKRKICIRGGKALQSCMEHETSSSSCTGAKIDSSE